MDGNESDEKVVAKDNERKADAPASDKRLEGKTTDSGSTPPEVNLEEDDNTETSTEENKTPKDHSPPAVSPDTKAVKSLQEQKVKDSETLDEAAQNREIGNTTGDIGMVYSEHAHSGVLKQDDTVEKLSDEETSTEENKNPKDHSSPAVSLDTEAVMSLQEQKAKDSETLDEAAKNREIGDTTDDVDTVYSEHARSETLEQDGIAEKLSDEETSTEENKNSRDHSPPAVSLDTKAVISLHEQMAKDSETLDEETSNEENKTPKDHSPPAVPLDTKAVMSLQEQKVKDAETLDEPSGPKESFGGVQANHKEMEYGDPHSRPGTERRESSPTPSGPKESFGEVQADHKEMDNGDSNSSPGIERRESSPMSSEGREYRNPHTKRREKGIQSSGKKESFAGAPSDHQSRKDGSPHTVPGADRRESNQQPSDSRECFDRVTSFQRQTEYGDPNTVPSTEKKGSSLLSIGSKEPIAGAPTDHQGREYGNTHTAPGTKRKERSPQPSGPKESFGGVQADHKEMDYGDPHSRPGTERRESSPTASEGREYRSPHTKRRERGIQSSGKIESFAGAPSYHQSRKDGTPHTVPGADRRESNQQSIGSKEPFAGEPTDHQGREYGNTHTAPGTKRRERSPQPSGPKESFEGVQADHKEMDYGDPHSSPGIERRESSPTSSEGREYRNPHTNRREPIKPSGPKESLGGVQADHKEMDYGDPHSRSGIERRESSPTSSEGREYRNPHTNRREPIKPSGPKENFGGVEADHKEMDYGDPHSRPGIERRESSPTSSEGREYRNPHTNRRDPIKPSGPTESFGGVQADHKEMDYGDPHSRPGIERRESSPTSSEGREYKNPHTNRREPIKPSGPKESSGGVQADHKEMDYGDPHSRPGIERIESSPTASEGREYRNPHTKMRERGIQSSGKKESFAGAPSDHQSRKDGSPHTVPGAESNQQSIGSKEPVAGPPTDHQGREHGNTHTAPGTKRRERSPQPSGSTESFDRMPSNQKERGNGDPQTRTKRRKSSPQSSGPKESFGGAPYDHQSRKGGSPETVPGTERTESNRQSSGSTVSFRGTPSDHQGREDANPHTDPGTERRENSPQELTEEFILYCPQLIQAELCFVGIQHEKFPLMQTDIKDIWTAKINIPTAFRRDSTYFYRLAQPSQYLGKYMYNRSKSEYFHLSDKTVHRDVFNRWSIEAVFQHVKDALCRDIHKFEINDWCIQMEEFLSFKTMNTQACKSVIEELLAVLNALDNKQRFLCAVAIGYLCSIGGISLNAKVLAFETAAIILRSFGNFELKTLPNSCRTYMLSLYDSLRNILFSNYSNRIELLVICYRFCGEDKASEEIRTDKFRKALSCVDINEGTMKSAEVLYEDAIINSIQRTSRASQELVENLTYYLPYKIVFSVYYNLTHKSSLATSDCRAMHCCMYEKMKYLLQDIQTNSDFVKLTDMLKVVHSSVGLESDFKNLFEHTLVQMLESNMRINEETKIKHIENLILKKGLFTQPQLQKELLSVLSVMQNEKLSNLFICFSDYTNATEIYMKVDCQCFRQWYYSTRKNQSSTKHYLKRTCVRLQKITNLPGVMKRQEIVTLLHDILVEELSRYRLEELVVEISEIDDIATEIPFIGNEIGAFIKGKLKERNTTTKQIDILKSFFNRKSQMIVDTTIQADIVCVILEQNRSKRKRDPTGELFIDIVEQVDLWQIIFNGSGSKIDRVRMHPYYQETEQCLLRTLSKIKDGDVSYDFIYFLEKTSQKSKLVLSLVTNVDEVEYACSSVKEQFNKEILQLERVEKVLNIIFDRGVCLPPNFKVLIDKVKQSRENFQSGKITMNKRHMIWQVMEELPTVCCGLLFVLESEIFWNLVHKEKSDNEDERKDPESCTDMDKTQTSLTLKEECTEECDLKDIEDKKEAEKHNTEDDTHTISLSSAVDYVQSLDTVRVNSYEKAWSDLRDGNNIVMKFVLTMFGNKPDLVKEKEIYNQTISAKFPDSIWNALEQVYSVEELAHSVAMVKKVLTVFEIDINDDSEFQTALESFDQLLTQNVADKMFLDVKKAVNTIFTIINGLSKQTLAVIEALSQSSSLVEFFKDTVNEDIKYLIDAVEDISEKHVQESTVSGLMEIKGYLHPLLTDDFKGKCRIFFDKLQFQTDNAKNIEVLPGKIEDCMENFHNLKSLYKNFANRGEQTKEIVSNIIHNGQFRFYLQPHNNVLNLEVSYTQIVECSKMTSEIDQKHVSVVKKKDVLIDLRSRSLLLMNTDRDDTENTHLSRKELGQFVAYIEESLDLLETLSTLHSSGHVKYMSIDETLVPEALLERNVQLTKLLRKWQDDLETERNEFYLLNFMQGSKLHLLYKYFHMFDSLDKQTQMILTENVETMLLFIHPDIKADEVRHMYNQERKRYSQLTNSNMLHCMGFALHEAWPRKEIKGKVKLKYEGKPFKMTDVVRNGELLVAQLDEASTNTVKTVIALYHNTTRQLPEPHQVLFCTRETGLDELELLIERCLGETQFCSSKGLSHIDASLFCIANVEMLPNEIQFQLLETLRQIAKRSNQYLLAVVCRGSRSHPFIDELNEFVTTVTPATDNTVTEIFHSQCPHVFTITSDLAGQGKSTFIQKKANEKKKGVAVLHISGCVRKQTLVQRLRDLRLRRFHLLHIDIGNIDDPIALDTFIFELIILRYVSSERVSVGLISLDVYFEISNTINNSLRDSLQTAMLFQRQHLKWNDFEDFLISKEIHSPVQIVCRYLTYLNKALLDKKDLTLNEFRHAISSRKCRRLLREHLKKSGDMSFPIAHASVNVLADQLNKMSCSPFFRISRLKDMIGNQNILNTKSSLVLSMLETTNEFASRSVSACRDTQASTLRSGEKSEQKSVDSHTVVTRVEGMIRWEESNHLMFVFHSQNIQTISPLYRDVSKVPLHIKDLFESQMKKSLIDFKTMAQHDLQEVLQKVARTDPRQLCPKELEELAKSYALTPDNLLKMVLIMLRLKAKVPVVIMGETGCGKTSLIRYLASICEIQLEVMNIHAGVSEEAIVERVMQCEEQAHQSLSKEIWLFLDEINTSESIGILSDVICHHKCLDTPLCPNLLILGACNPYKLRTSKAIASAGLTGKSKSDELSRLIYRVLPLPEMMVDYVWDFGSLSESDEKLYIQRMVDNVFTEKVFHTLFVNLLSESQSFVRGKEASAYVVSLRDVARCKRLTSWFLDVLQNKKRCPKEKYSMEWPLEVRAMVLALAHCYHSRFADKEIRQEYRNKLKQLLRENLSMVCVPTSDYIQDIIVEEQNDFLIRMDVPEGTARNTALMENVFVILVCIFNKIPIFVVGKPGCSKSLAMQVIRSNLRGKDSKDDFFKKLPQLYCVSFQGSESSTSDGIMKVFEKAENYQKLNSEDDVLSVVILDEIGLAEISRFNPLKVLHNLLESDGQNGPNVAVVGISNWSLDASKMNRAIHLSRTDMDRDELFQTARSISDSFMPKIDEIGQTISTFYKGFEQRGKVKRIKTSDIEKELENIAKCYSAYTKQLRFKNFHGLRDYYALVKYVARRFSKVRNSFMPDSVLELMDEEKSDIVMDGLERNFGGLPNESESLFDIFNNAFKFKTPFKKNILELIDDNVGDPAARHLMLITSGDAALGILEQQLKNMGRANKEVIFGSQFEEDLTDDYNYRILSRIILCMEQGVVLVLKDLEMVYGSLYDMLNQNYTIIGRKKNCRVALGAYSNPICHVADSFRCIVLMDEGKLDSCDPPFLNRFEKQYLRFTDILDKDDVEMIKHLDSWIKDLKGIHKKYFEFLDVFPIYSEDLLASLVLKINNEFRNGPYTRGSSNEYEILRECKSYLLWIMKPEAVIRLKMAMSESMKRESEEIKEEYFKLPLHGGLEELISKQLQWDSDIVNKGILTIVFTNSNVHTKLTNCIEDRNVQIDKIGAFKSEKQLSARIQQFWSKDSDAEFLLVQCSAVDDEKHIILTKSTIERCKEEFLTKMVGTVKHVYLIIHLDSSKGTSKITSQINFVSEWKLAMVDSLERPKIPLKEFCELELLAAIDRKRPLQDCLTEQLFWAFTRIKYSSFGRDIDSIQRILVAMKEDKSFISLLDNEIWKSVSKLETTERDWQVTVACDVQALRNSACFIDALEQYIINVINVPLSKLIYNMEVCGILDSYFINDSRQDERKKVWETVLQDERVFSIEDIPNENGPECYVCNTADLSLCMPFSRIIYSRLEAQKDAYLEELSLIKTRFELKSEERLPPEVYGELMKKQERFIVQNLPDGGQYFYKSWEQDYIDDFCSILSLAMCPNISREQRKMYMKWVVNQKVRLKYGGNFHLLVSLHVTSWTNSTLFRAEMQLFGICEKVLIDKDILKEILHSNEQKGIDNPSEDNEIGNTDYNEQDAGFGKINSLQEVSFLNVDSSLEKYIVQLICRSMLPSSKTLKTYDGIQNWQRKINTVLALAAKVSRNSTELHSLRVCNEVASNLIIPFKIEKALLERMGSLLLEERALDSSDVFVSLVKIIQNVYKKHEHGAENCYTVLSSYLIRCYNFNPETEILDEVFKLLLAGSLPSEIIPHLKAPLFLAFDMEDDEFNTLLQISIENETSDDNDDANTSRPVDTLGETNNENRNGSISESVLVNQLDCVLQQLHINGKCDCPLALLFIDILTMMYGKSVEQQLQSEGEKAVFSTVYRCHKVLLEEKFGIRKIAAIAYLKSFFSDLGEDQLSDYDETKDNWNALVVILSDFKSGHISMSLLLLFLKMMSQNMTVCRLRKFLNRFSDKVEFLKEIPWEDNYENRCFERSPLCSIADCSMHKMVVKAFLDPGQIPLVSKQLVQIGNNSPTDLIELLNCTVSHFLYPKSCEAITDTKRSFASAIVEEMRLQNSSFLKIFKFFTGQEDFKVTFFNLGDESNTSSTQYSMITVFMSFYIILLSNNALLKRPSLLTQCLCSISDIDSVFMPGFLDDDDPKHPMNASHSTLYTTSRCGFRIAYHDEKCVEKCKRCLFCTEEVMLKTNETANTETLPKKGVVWKYDDMEHINFTVRNLHPLSCHILQMFVKSCLVGSLAFGFSNTEEIIEFTGIQDIDSDGTIIWEDIEKHWLSISAMLNMSDSVTAIFLHRILFESVTLFTDSLKHCKNSSERDIWENSFEAIMNDAIKCRTSLTSEYILKHNEKHGIKENSVETLIFEANKIHDVQRNEMLPLLFRVTANPTKESFLSEFYWQRKHFPFLDLVLQYECYLKMPVHIYNIIQWHMGTVSNANYVLKKYDCQEMTVESFIYFKPEGKGTKLESIFKNFQNSWNSLKPMLQYHKIASKMEVISKQSKMKECLIYSKDTTLYEVLQILIQVQNDFLDKALELAKTCSSLHFLSREESVSALPCVQITEVKLDDLINFKFDWEETFSGESICTLEYGKGCQITYDFGSIEKGLAMREIAGKSYISFQNDLPNIMFTDELFINYASLITELKSKVEQCELSTELETGVRNKITEDPRIVRDLLTHLGILMTLLKKTGGEMGKPLVEYAFEWSNILTHEFPRQLLPNPEASVKLCHIVALSSLLEEICADSVIDALEVEYREPLDQNITGQIMTILRKEHFARALLKAIKIFAHRCLSTKSADWQRPLSNYLSDESFWPDGSKRQNNVIITGKTENLLSLLPKYIMVRHVYTIVKMMESEIKKQEEDSLKLRQLHSTFQQNRAKHKPLHKSNTKRSKAARFRDF